MYIIMDNQQFFLQLQFALLMETQVAQYAPNRDNGQSTFLQNTVEKIVKESTPKQDFVKATNAEVR